MNYKFTLTVEAEEEDNIIFDGSCLTLEGIEEELVRKAKSAISQYEGEQEIAMQQAIDEQKEEEQRSNKK